MKIPEVETAAGVLSDLWGEWRLIAKQREYEAWVKRHTRSTSGSLAESAFLTEPLPDFKEEDIIRAFRRRVGLTKGHEKRRERGQQEGGVNGKCMGLTLRVDHRAEEAAMRGQRCHAGILDG